MSSHHIVREKQEPALFILNYSEKFDLEYLGQLLEWSPTVITNDETYEYLKIFNIKVDIIFTKNKNYITHEESIKIIYSNFLLKDVFTYLINIGHSALNIISSEIELNDILLYSKKLNLVLYTENKKVYFINNQFTKWIEKGTKIEILTNFKRTFGLSKLNGNIYEKDKDGFFSIEFLNNEGLIAEFLS